MKSAHENLETCLSRWDSYEESQAEIQKWLSEIDEKLKGEIKLQNTLEEKEKLVEEYQVRTGEKIISLGQFGAFVFVV